MELEEALLHTSYGPRKIRYQDLKDHRAIIVTQRDLTETEEAILQEMDGLFQFGYKLVMETKDYEQGQEMAQEIVTTDGKTKYRFYLVWKQIPTKQSKAARFRTIRMLHMEVEVIEDTRPK